MIGVGLSISEIAVRSRASGPALDSSAVTLIAAMTVPPSADRQTKISTLITALKAAGVWTKLDLLYLTAAHDVQAAKLNWLNPAFAPLIAVNSPAFAVDRGFTGDGATSNLQTTGVNISTLTNFRQDDATFFGWSNTDGTGASGDFGVSGGGTPWAIVRNATNFFQSRLNCAATASAANSGGIGFFGASRNNAADFQQYKNGVAIGTATVAVSNAVSALTFSICKGLTSFSVRQIGGGGAGKAFTAPDWAALYAAVLVYMQGVGNA